MLNGKGHKPSQTENCSAWLRLIATNLGKKSMIYLFSCCQSDGRGGTQKLPDFCFEQNGCNGLWWLGADACSSHLVDSVANVLKSLKNPEIPKTIVSEKRVVYKSSIVLT